MLQNPHLRTLARYTSTITQATTAAAKDTITFKYTIFPILQIGPHHITTKFHVAENSSQEIIIGLLFLRQTNAPPNRKSMGQSGWLMIFVSTL